METRGSNRFSVAIPRSLYIAPDSTFPILKDGTCWTPWKQVVSQGIDGGEIETSQNRLRLCNLEKAPHCGAKWATRRRERRRVFILPTYRTGKFLARSSNRRGEFGFKRWLTAAWFSPWCFFPTHPAKPHKPLHRRKHGGALWPLQGVRVSRKEMRKAVAGFAGDQPNAMLALSAEERFFLSALAMAALLRHNRSDSQCSIVLLMEYFRVII